MSRSATTIGISCKSEEAKKEIFKLKKECKNIGLPLWTIEPIILIEGLKKAIREKKES